MIYHVVVPAFWKSQENNEFYFSETFATEGFIHCSTEQQLEGVLQRYYANAGEVIKLTLDEEELTSPLLYEEATNNELFPHIYGGINQDAITAIDTLVEIFPGEFITKY
jgi:uncharacterized protein (DUF952 family)